MPQQSNTFSTTASQDAGAAPASFAGPAGASPNGLDPINAGPPSDDLVAAIAAVSTPLASADALNGGAAP